MQHQTPGVSVEVIRSVPLFATLDDRGVRLLSEAAVPGTFQAGEPIFRVGDIGDGMYFIERGKVRIHAPDSLGQNVTLAELGPGDFFGEMAVLSRNARTATATALTEARVHRLSQPLTLAILRLHPDAALEIARVSAARLERTDLLLRERVSRNLNDEETAHMTLADRMADRIAAFGGSWRFIFGSLALILLWIAINTFLLRQKAFDPYPYVLLNLVLAVITGLQAPMILMAQNRQNEKDRLRADLDYKLNLKNELVLSELLRRFEGLEEAVRIPNIRGKQHVENGRGEMDPDS